MSVACVVAGGIIIDNVVMPDGVVHLQLVGGNAVHAAIGARLWSDAVGVVGLVPRNYPAEALERLAAAIDVSGVRRIDEDVACSEWFFYAPDGTRVDRLHATAEEFAAQDVHHSRLSPAEILRWRRHLESRTPAGNDFGSFRRRHPIAPRDMPAAYADAPALHLATGLPAAQLALLRDQRPRRRCITLDPGHHAATLSAEDLDALLAMLDGFLPSEIELAALCPGDAIESALVRLGARTRGTVAVKLGAAGSAVLAAPPTDSLPRTEATGGRSACGPRRVPVVPVTARDPTGAGDAFCGGFVVGLARTGDPVLAACLGTVSASFAVETVGALAALAADRRVAHQRLTLLLARVGSDHRADAFVPASPT